MGLRIEGKALGVGENKHGYYRDSLEEDNSFLFFGEADEEQQLDPNSKAADNWAADYDEAADNEFLDTFERKEFWDSQEALLLVFSFLVFSLVFTDSKALLLVLFLMVEL